MKNAVESSPEEILQSLSPGEMLKKSEQKDALEVNAREMLKEDAETEGERERIALPGMVCRCSGPVWMNLLCGNGLSTHGRWCASCC